MRARIATLVGAAAIAAALAAPAAQAESAKFVAHVSGKQKLYWEVGRYYTYSDCQGRRWIQQGGFENLSFRSARPQRVLITIRRGADPDVRYGTWRRFGRDRLGLRITGELYRSGRILHGIDPDSRCFDAGDPTQTDTGPYDCGARQSETIAQVELFRRKAFVNTNGFLPEPFRNCPLTEPDGIIGGRPHPLISPQPGLVRDLLDPDKGLIVLRGSQSFRNPIASGKGFAEAQVNWTVRLRRAR